jgi:hypothetical protein
MNAHVSCVHSFIIEHSQCALNYILVQHQIKFWEAALKIINGNPLNKFVQTVSMLPDKQLSDTSHLPKPSCAHTLPICYKHKVVCFSNVWVLSPLRVGAHISTAEITSIKNLPEKLLTSPSVQNKGTAIQDYSKVHMQLCVSARAHT